MKYIIDVPGKYYKESGDLTLLKKVLENPSEYWKGGAGDSVINLPGKRDCLIFFKVEKGIFIENLPKVTAPLIKKEAKPEVITHYVGGEPMYIPDVCLMDEETAYKIMSYFIVKNGQLHPDYQWVHIVDVIPEAYEDML